MKKSTFWLLFGVFPVALLVADIVKGDYGFFGFWWDLVSVALIATAYVFRRKEERIEEARKREILIHFNNLAATDPEAAKRIAEQYATWDLR